MVLAEQQGNQNMQFALHITITVVADKTSGQHSSRIHYTALSFSSVKSCWYDLGAEVDKSAPLTSGCHSRCPLCSCPTWPATLLVAPLIASLGWACHQLSSLAQLPQQAVGVRWPPERGQQGMLPQGRRRQKGSSCCLCEWPSAFPSSPLPKAAEKTNFVKMR